MSTFVQKSSQKIFISLFLVQYAGSISFVVDITTCMKEFLKADHGLTNPLISTSKEARSSQRCRCCLALRPKEDFRRRYRGREERMTECRLCHNKSEQMRQHFKRGLLTKRQYQKYLTSLKEQQTSRGVERVFLSLAKLCGGTEGLLEMWAEAMEKDFKAGGLKAHRHIAAIIRLMQYHEAQQHQRIDYSTMSDEELLERVSRESQLMSA